LLKTPNLGRKSLNEIKEDMIIRWRMTLFIDSQTMRPTAVDIEQRLERTSWSTLLTAVCRGGRGGFAHKCHCSVRISQGIEESAPSNKYYLDDLELLVIIVVGGMPRTATCLLI
jgi:hypothetical protein